MSTATPHYWQGYFALVTCCHFQWSKNKTTKNGSPKFRSILCKCKRLTIRTATPPVIGKDFFPLVLHTTTWRVFYFTSVSSCMDCYPTTIGKDFFALVICLDTSNKAEMLPLKIGLLTLGVAFSDPRYSLVRDSYHQEYS